MPPKRKGAESGHEQSKRRSAGSVESDTQDSTEAGDSRNSVSPSSQRPLDFIAHVITQIM
jgi:hypothetical protein